VADRVNHRRPHTLGACSVQITISARHGHLSPSTQAKVTEKVESVRKFFDRITSIQVTVDLEHRERPSVEVRISAEHHDEFVAVDQADTVLAAVDGVVDKVETQLRKFKERLKEHRATGHKHLEPPLPPTEPE
jgi:putative sigma-54 modulation protein